MILTEKYMQIVQSHKDIEITDEFLERMNECLYKDCKVPNGFKISEKTLQDFANDIESNMKFEWINTEGDETSLDDWVSDYIGDYFFYIPCESTDNIDCLRIDYEIKE